MPSSSSSPPPSRAPARPHSTPSHDEATEDLPRVIIFDLDGTLWNPELYQMYRGPPFQAHPSNPNIAVGQSGNHVQLIGESRAVLHTLATDPRWSKTHLAISSTCDRVPWAHELLSLFTIEDASGRKVSLKSIFKDRMEIYYACKAEQHRTIMKKIRATDPTVTTFREMLFFDNQRDNIESVSSLGVACYYCPRGMVPGTFQKGLDLWRKQWLALL